jgi:hypothetical protein
MGGSGLVPVISFGSQNHVVFTRAASMTGSPGVRIRNSPCATQHYFQCVAQPRAGIVSDLPLNWTSTGSSLKFSTTRLPSLKR